MPLFSLLTYGDQHLKLSKMCENCEEKKLTQSFSESAAKDWMEPLLFIQLTASKHYCEENKLRWDK